MLSSRIVIAVALGSAWMLSAQSQPATQPPVGVKRVPPAATAQSVPGTAVSTGSSVDASTRAM